MAIVKTGVAPVPVSPSTNLVMGLDVSYAPEVGSAPLAPDVRKYS